MFLVLFLGIKQHYLRLSFCIVHNNIGGLVHKLSNLKQYINRALLVDHILFGFSTSLFFQFSITEESSKAHLPHRDDAIEVHFVATNSNHKMLPTQMK